MRVGCMLDAQRGVFFTKLGNRCRQLHFVLAILEPKPNRLDSFRRGRRLDLHNAALFCGQRFTSTDALQPAQRDCIASFRRCAFLRLLTLDGEKPCCTFFLAILANQNGTIGNFASQNARERKLAARLRVDVLEYVRRTLGVFQFVPPRGLAHKRDFMAQSLQQP